MECALDSAFFGDGVTLAEGHQDLQDDPLEKSKGWYPLRAAGSSSSGMVVRKIDVREHDI